ncbi:MAG: class I SAM-dependent methyltransferase [Betaproteobacteria bacterium]
MTSDLEFTGERFLPGKDGEIVYEHVHRYAFARALVAGKRVLDAACGEGYGSALLATAAASVTGIDIDAPTIAHARKHYAAVANLAFTNASVTALPLADASVDVVVSFETIEHLPASAQPRMLAEFARVLAADGWLLLSAPNRVEYSDNRGFVNPFHLHEHDRRELDALLAPHFAARAFFSQRMWMGSTIWREEGDLSTVAAHVGDSAGVAAAVAPAAMYYVVLAARSASALPQRVAGVSLFTDGAGSELARGYAAMREAMRLDAILGERTQMLDQQTAHVEHLEKLVAVRDGIIVERDGQLDAQSSRMQQFERQDAELRSAVDASRREADELRTQAIELQAATSAQERIIDYRQGLRWWLMLPWLRLRSWWQHVRGQ